MKKIKSQFYGIDFVKDEKIQNISTYHNKGHVKCVFYPKNSKQLIFLYNLFSINKIPFKVIGNGSNILISPKGKNYFYISTKNMRHYIRFNKNYCTINCSCPISFVYQKCLANSLSGFENIAGIPGTIGGAIKMNAGSFGSDISENIEYVKILKNNKITKIKKENLNFGYRNSSFKNCLILSARFKLIKKDQNTIQQVFLKNLSLRSEKQPRGYSCGSVFKNPQHYSAGFLIESCGLKGKQKGEAQISSKHANFIINKQNADYQDIKYLINLCKKEVYKKYKIKLKCEIEII